MVFLPAPVERYITGNLLIADPETKTHIGKLYVTEIGRKILNKEGQFVYSTMYAWNGLGFSSKSGDRISFFAVSGANEGLNEIIPDTESEPEQADLSTITTEDDKVVSIKNSEVKNRNMNYFIQWLVDCGIKMIYVSGIDEKIKRFFEQMKIIVNVKNQSDKTLLLAEITSQK